MAENSGFFNANLVKKIVDGVEREVYDREYLAQEFAGYFATFIGNGVFPNPSTNLQVVFANDMTVNLMVGKAWIDGYWYENTELKSFILKVGTGTLDRIDSIVIRYSSAGRIITAELVEGVPAVTPVPIAPKRDADAYELVVAHILVKKGTILLKQSDITDTRLNKNLCGLVVGLIEQIDVTTIFNQFQDYYNSKTAEWDKQLEDQQTIWQDQTDKQQTDWATQTEDQASQWLAQTEQQKTDWETQTNSQQTFWDAQTKKQKSDWESQTAKQQSDWQAQTQLQQNTWVTQTNRQESDWNTQTERQEADYQTQEARLEKEFREWFDTVQGLLEGDVAANLLKRIMDHEANQEIHVNAKYKERWNNVPLDADVTYSSDTDTYTLTLKNPPEIMPDIIFVRWVSKSFFEIGQLFKIGENIYDTKNAAFEEGDVVTAQFYNGIAYFTSGGGGGGPAPDLGVAKVVITSHDSANLNREISYTIKDGATTNAQVDETGVLTLTLSPGTYTFRVNSVPSGYRTPSPVQVTISAGRRVTVPFFMAFTAIDEGKTKLVVDVTTFDDGEKDNLPVKIGMLKIVNTDENGHAEAIIPAYASEGVLATYDISITPKKGYKKPAPVTLTAVDMGEISTDFFLDEQLIEPDKTVISMAVSTFDNQNKEGITVNFGNETVLTDVNGVAKITLPAYSDGEVGETLAEYIVKVIAPKGYRAPSPEIVIAKPGEEISLNAFLSEFLDYTIFTVKVTTYDNLNKEGVRVYFNNKIAFTDVNGIAQMTVPAFWQDGTIIDYGIQVAVPNGYEPIEGKYVSAMVGQEVPMLIFNLVKSTVPVPPDNFCVGYQFMTWDKKQALERPLVNAILEVFTADGYSSRKNLRSISPKAQTDEAGSVYEEMFIPWVSASYPDGLEDYFLRPFFTLAWNVKASVYTTENYWDRDQNYELGVNMPEYNFNKGERIVLCSYAEKQFNSWGVEINIFTSSFVAYSGNAKNMEPAADEWMNHWPFNEIKPVMLKDGIEQYDLMKTDITKKVDGTPADITSGADGDVMVYIPPMFLAETSLNLFFGSIGKPELEVSSTNVVRLNVCKDLNCVDRVKSAVSVNGWYQTTSSFDGVSTRGIYVGAFKASLKDSKLRSLSNAEVLTNLSAVEYTNLVSIFPKGYILRNVRVNMLLQWLFMLYYGSVDSQRSLGRGYVGSYDASKLKTGATVSIPTANYGDKNSDIQKMKFLWMEDLWGAFEELSLGEWLYKVQLNVEHYAQFAISGDQASLRYRPDYSGGGSYTWGTNGISLSTGLSGYTSNALSTTQYCFFGDVAGSSNTWAGDWISAKKPLYGEKNISYYGGKFGDGSKAGLFSRNLTFKDTEKNPYGSTRLVYVKAAENVTEV